MKKRVFLKDWILLLVIVAAASPAAGQIIYVDDDAGGSNNGSSWENAYNYLQDALADANSASKPVEIRVAQGTYTPDSNSSEPNGTNYRNATFQLINEVILKGGYAGFGEPDPNFRNIELYETILSGDINTVGYDSDNSYHVVTGSGTDPNAVLDGFTITHGKADERAGGGMYNYEGSPTLFNCTFRENSAGDRGGGMYNGRGNPKVVGCIFEGNKTGDPDAQHFTGFGGGMFNTTCSPVITDCIFTKNWAYTAGGGMCNTNNMGKIINCTFSDNTASGYHQPVGGGMHNTLYNPTIVGCTFSGNRAYTDSSYSSGGGIFSTYRNSITNCTFSGNFASVGGGIWTAEPHQPLINCIFYDNRALIGKEIRSATFEHIEYCDIEGGQESVLCDNLIWGPGNIDVEPCFVLPGHWDPNGTPADANDDFWIHGDYHLKSQAGRWNPDTQSWIKDDITSPCIDAGDPASPIGYEPFPNGGIINMGAYSGTAEASKSYFGEPVCETIIAGDINGDCIVNFKDFAFMAYHWLEDKR